MNTNISVEYSSGERLYITPVFVPKKNTHKTYDVYIVKDFKPYDFIYEVRSDINSSIKNIKLTFYKLWKIIKYLDVISIDFWKYSKINLRCINHIFFKSIIVHGFIENDFCISTNGQLCVVDPYGYSNTYYLDPSQKYLHERFFEFLRKDSELTEKWCILQKKYPEKDYDLFFIAELDT